MKNTLLILSAILVGTFSEVKASEGENSAAPPDLLRCERFIKSTLKELKSKLQENCDLNKPFSTSLAINIAEEHYMYCCHKKK